MKVIQSGVFSRSIKKLHKKEKAAIDRAVRKIISNTTIGDMKKGALAGVRVHKFKVADKQYLLAYRTEKKSGLIMLLALGSHENFYRDLSK
ncbi:MAG: mRNA-degrading endonuclease YafQ of YafQ-DinJ toxin-antitoxin module [Gammaproteobacteria bacterium]|jgi:mRNA-degrading endonuclease YafQ of YafQ-DinJ toxin-antitoxin module